MKPTEIRALLLSATNVTTMVSMAKKNFKSNAKSEPSILDEDKPWAKFRSNLFTGILSNAAFVLLVLAIYLIAAFVAPTYVAPLTFGS